MKVALLSDIHGNAVALEAVIKDIQKRQVDKIFVLGDLCLRGPQPKEALNLVRSLNAEVVKGNADGWLVRGFQKGEVKEHAFDIMNKERDWTLTQLNDEDIRYLNDLPLSITMSVGGMTICAFHATPTDLFEVVLPEASNDVYKEKFFVKDADIYFYGHIHNAYIRYINGKTVVNLGSVSLPFDGVNKASYALLEVDDNSYQTSIIKVGYDIEKFTQQIKDSGFPNKEILSTFKRIGGSH
jgi:putative phosphoesterase